MGRRQVVDLIAQGPFEGRVDLQQVALIGNHHEVGRQVEETLESLPALDQALIDVFSVSGGGEQGLEGGHHPEQALARLSGEILWYPKDAKHPVVVMQRDSRSRILAGRLTQVDARELQSQRSSKVLGGSLGRGPQIGGAQHQVSQVGR